MRKIIKGDVNLANLYLTELFDLSDVEVTGYFNCNDNELKDYNFIKKTGLIKAHAGEVYTGGGTLKMFEGMWQEMKNQNQQLKEQNRYLAAGTYKEFLQSYLDRTQ